MGGALMDPNVNLERQLDVAREMIALIDGPVVESTDLANALIDLANELAELVIAQHDWITSGGFLPEAWTNKGMAQGAALARLVTQRGAPERVHVNKPDEWMMAGYWLVRFPDGFECGIAPNGDVSS
jgi:hypothetical protein